MPFKITKYVEITRWFFSTAQFLLNGFSQPYRFGRSSNGGNILLYVRDDLPLRLLTGYEIKENVESFFIC